MVDCKMLNIQLQENKAYRLNIVLCLLPREKN